MLAKAYFVYNKIKKTLPLPEHYSRLDIIDQEFLLLWEELEKIRRKQGELSEPGNPISISEGGNIILGSASTIRLPKLEKLKIAKKTRKTIKTYERKN